MISLSFSDGWWHHSCHRHHERELHPTVVLFMPFYPRCGTTVALSKTDCLGAYLESLCAPASASPGRIDAAAVGRQAKRAGSSSKVL